MGFQVLCSFHRSILLKTTSWFGQVTYPVFILLTSLLYQPMHLTSNVGLLLNGLYHCRVSQLEPSYERCSRREKARARMHTRHTHTIHAHTPHTHATHTPHTHSPHTKHAHTKGGEGVHIHPLCIVSQFILTAVSRHLFYFIEEKMETEAVQGASSNVRSQCLLPCGKLTPSWPVARQTSVSLEWKCWGCGDPLRATFQKQLFPGVAAPGLQSEGRPLDSGHGPRQEELVPGAAVVTCQVTLPGAALFMNFGGNVFLRATLVIAGRR